MSPSRFDSVVTHLIYMLEVLDSNFGCGFFFCVVNNLSWRVPVLCIGNLTRRNLSKFHWTFHNNTPFTFISLQRKPSYVFIFIFVCVAQQLKSGLSRLIFEVSKSLIITHTRARTLYDSSEPGISPSHRPLPTQHTTNRRDDHSCLHLDSNPRSQQSSSCRPTP